MCRTYFVKLEKNCLDSRLGLSFSCIADNANEPTQQQPSQHTCVAPCVPPTHQVGSPLSQPNHGLPRHDVEPPSIFNPPLFPTIPGKILTQYYSTHSYLNNQQHAALSSHLPSRLSEPQPQQILVSLTWIVTSHPTPPYSA